MSVLRNAHLLRQFLAIVGEGSLTSAAQKIAVTQSALTKSMKKLEDELGAPLFERLPRGIALTAYGKSLLPHAQRIVAECRLADLELQSFGMGHRGMLRIGAGLLFGATFVPIAISAMYARYPGIAFQLLSGVTATNLALLEAGEIDLMFGMLPDAGEIPDYLAVRPIVELNSRVVAGKSHPLARKRNVGAADLARYPWVVIQHDRDVVNRILETIGGESEGRPRINVEVTSLSSMIRLLRSGLYLACFSESIAATPDSGLSVIAYRRRMIAGQSGVVFHRSLERYGPAIALIDEVQDAARMKIL